MREICDYNCVQLIRYNNIHLTDRYLENGFNIWHSSRRLAMASAPLELAWLHHEFCKFLIDIRRFDLARFYVKKGRDMAQEAKCIQWILNIDHLTLRMEIHQNNRNEAKDAAISTLACARKLDIDCLVKIKFSRFPEYVLVIAPLSIMVEFTLRSISDYILLKIGLRRAQKSLKNIEK